MRALVLSLALLVAASAVAAAAPVRRPAARPAGAAAPASVLPWLADDWPKALEIARQRKLPIFVENWAPW